MCCKKGKFGFFISLCTAILAVCAVATIVFFLFERKKKKEEQELEDYLDMAIV